jgi:hypothetical protein
VFGEIRFETAAAHQTDGGTVGADDHARADPTVARAGNAYDGCQHDRFTIGCRTRKRAYDFAVRSHRLSNVIRYSWVANAIDFNVQGGRLLVQRSTHTSENLAPRVASSHVPAQSPPAIEVVIEHASSR